MANQKAVAVTAVVGLILQILTVAVTAPVAASSDNSAPSGAIFTTDENGTRVNQNIYEDKRDVYIDGGPGPNAPQSAAGLDDGNYYFQVTGTDGKTLLSSDPVKCREFRVESGIIVEYVSANRTYPVPGGARFCHLDGKQFGRHDTGTDSDHNAVTIQLMPFNNTSNPGGVYKVWVTPTSEFQGNASLVDNDCGSGCQHGFLHSESKTDNFKVRPSGNFVAPTITVQKFEDLDGDGTWDSGEPEIGVDTTINGGGWPVAVVDPAGIASYGYTRYTYQVGFGGNHTVVEGSNSGWVQTALIVDGTAKAVNATAKVKVNYTSGETHTVVYGNFHSFKVSGAKVNDTDGDGQADSNEGKLSGWTIQLYRNGNLYASANTGSDGTYSFTVSQGGSYVVKEVNKDGWTQTGHKDFSFTGKSGVDRTNLVFTNHQNSSNCCGGCIILCITLNVPISIDIDVDVSFNVVATTDVSAFVLNCVQLIADVTAEAEATASAAVDTDNGCECDTSSSSGGFNSCDTGCDTSSSSGGSSTCDTGCSDTSTDVSVDVSADVGADVGASGGSSCETGCSNTCDTSCGSDTSCACDTTTDVSTDVSVDVSADVGADAGSCGCDSTSVDVGADVSVDVGADVGVGL